MLNNIICLLQIFLICFTCINRCFFALFVFLSRRITIYRNSLRKLNFKNNFSIREILLRYNDLLCYKIRSTLSFKKIYTNIFVPLQTINLHSEPKFSLLPTVVSYTSACFFNFTSPNYKLLESLALIWLNPMP